VQGRKPGHDIFHWAQTQAIFDSDDWRLFPPLSKTIPPDDRAIFRGYISKAKDLASSSALNAKDGMTIRISDDGQTEQIETSFSPPDVVAGFAAIFRQFYANGERVSLHSVASLMTSLANAETGDQTTGSRIIGNWYVAGLTGYKVPCS
jgi:hypothetical protein